MEYLPTFVSQLDYDYISHHGIKGMKWGIRRYQNPDGSLTLKGKQRYRNTKTLYKDLRKQVHKKRAKEHGSGNGFRTVTPIGDHSKKYIEDSRQKRRDYENSDAYKKWADDYNKFEKKWLEKFENTYNYDPEMERQYSKEQNEKFKHRPRKNFNDPFDGYYTLSAKGRKYSKKYLNGAGKDLTMAYIRDLGYSESVANKMVDQLIKSGRSLGMD